MNASIALGAALIVGTLAVSPASAGVSYSQALATSPVTQSDGIANVDFVQGHEAIAGTPARAALIHTEASRQAAQRYFDFDVIITLGALAIASGAFVAAGIAGSRRRGFGDETNAGEAWRGQVMQALEADLTRYAVSLRRAA